MRIIFSPRSRQDLKEIAAFISRQNPTRAISFTDELIDEATSIGFFPESFQQAGINKYPFIRRKPHGKYLIFYEIRESEVVIRRILHGARRISGRFFKD